jgi:hypothetical protein
MRPLRAFALTVDKSNNLIAFAQAVAIIRTVKWLKSLSEAADVPSHGRQFAAHA